MKIEAAKAKKIIDIAILIALLLLSFSIPCFSNNYPFNYITIALAVAFVVALLVKMILFHRKVYFGYYVFSLIIFIITIFISQLFNGQLNVFPKSVLLLAILGIFIYEFSKSYDYKNQIYFVFLLGGLLFALVFFVYYRNQIIHLSLSNRLGAEFNDQNQLARIISIYAIIAFAFAFIAKTKLLRISSIISIFVFLLVIVLTGSISNLLCVILTFVIAGLLMTKGTNRIIFLLSFISIIGAATIVVFVEPSGYFKERISGIVGTLFNVGTSKDGSTSNRLFLAINTFKMFLVSPIFGNGYFSVSEFNMYGITGHNNFFQLLADMGIFGFVAFEFPFFYAIGYLSFKRKDHYVSKSLSIFLVIFQFFLTTYHQKMDYLIMPVALSMIETEEKCSITFFAKEKDETGKTYFSRIINTGISNNMFKMRLITFINNLKHSKRILLKRTKDITNPDNIFNTEFILKNGVYYMDDHYYRNAFFGHSDLMRKYSNFEPRIYSMIEHGLYFGDFCLDDEINSNCFDSLITFSDYRKEVILSKKPDLAVYKVGPYIAYANSILAKKDITKIKKNLGKTLLVFPSHSIKEIKTSFDESEFIKEIDRVKSAQQFDSVIVCLFYQDIMNNPNIAEPYVKKGFIVTTCGDRFDNNFLRRQRALFEICDASMSNSAGTHIGYSIYLEKPHYCYRQDVKKEATVSGINKEIANESAQKMKNKLMSAFEKPTFKITKSQYDICNKIFGYDEVKTKKEMQSLLEKLYVNYFKRLDDEEKINNELKTV